MSTLSDRMNALQAALAAAYPARVVTRNFVDFAQRGDDDLIQGVYTLISRSEGDYARYTDDSIADGTHQIWIVGQTRVAENAEPSAVEDAEGVMIDEIKAFLNVLPPALGSLQLNGWRQSEQMDYPYAGVAFEFTFIQ